MCLSQTNSVSSDHGCSGSECNVSCKRKLSLSYKTNESLDTLADMTALSKAYTPNRIHC